MWYDTLNEKALWSVFQEISAIPRESGNEEGVRNWLLKWAGERNLEADTDKTGNVFIYAPGSEGREGDAPLCLQGHMDMVCVKTADSAHDFSKDPIEIVLENGVIRAKDTSLGADNGIAVAMALALASDSSISRPPLELLFTVSEETGLTGAFNLDGSKLKSRRLVNLDSEEEGIIYTGCAGGIEIEACAKAKMKPLEYKKADHWSLEVSGLLGGHSGGEIHKGRANAIKLAARCLHRLPDFMLTSLDGGTRRNVIPSSCKVTFVADAEFRDTVESVVAQVAKEVANEYKLTDPGVEIRLTKLEKVPAEAVKTKTSLAFTEALYLTPAGVQSMSAGVPGVVETSNNLAIAKLEDGKLVAVSSTRSLVESSRDETAYTVGAVNEDFGFDVKYSGAYPGWEPDPNSELAKKTAALWKSYTKKKPVVTCIHAGLECGIINSRVEGMDSVSIGPNLFDVHSVNEHVEVDSAERMMGFMRHLLANI